MAEPVNKIILAVVQDDCSSLSCPYRYGDESHSKRFLEKVDRKLKYRVADGNEVRVLKRRVGELEAVLSQILEVGERKKLSQQDLAKIRSILQKGKQK